MNKYYVTNNLAKKSIDSQGREIFWFLVTSENIDRQGEIVKSDSYDIEKFMQNPVMFFQHNSYSLPIGKWLEFEKTNDGLMLGGWFHELPDENGNNLSKTIKDYVANEIIVATSIGFRPVEWHVDRIDNKKIMVYDKIDLVEVSVVTIGANPEALAKLKFFNNGDEMEITEKAGSVLSKSNLEKLIMAIENINSVINSAKKDEDEDAKDNTKDAIEALTLQVQQLTQKLLEVEDKLKPKRIKINGDNK